MDTLKLKQKMKESNLSLYKLSIKSKVAYSTLYEIMSGKTKNPGINTITRIAKALNEKVENLI